jgi:glycosyltransferase involved in cell wall biosynthesis
LGRRQVVRQRFLVPPSLGSNPSAPASARETGIHDLTAACEKVGGVNRNWVANAYAYLRQVYWRMPQRHRAMIPAWFKDAAKAVGRMSPLVVKYETRLWGGFSRTALGDLVRLKDDPDLAPRDRADAALTMARWFAAKGDFARALSELDDRRRIDPRGAAGQQQFLLEAMYMARLGRAEQARDLLERRMTGRPFSSSVELLLANTWNPAVTGRRDEAAESNVLLHINRVFRHYGLAEIDKRNSAEPLTIDNLRGINTTRVDDPTRVTVIVPAYNSAATIGTALRSLADQTWTNLEVLVVDDCSTDDTVKIVEGFCTSDQRFRLIRQPVNRGSYAARNAALKQATGDYITINDADDWAHPQRIEVQMRARDLRQRFSTAQWVRASEELEFVGITEQVMNLNLGSVFFERSLTDRIGVWDEVRVSADYEFMRRFEGIMRTKRPVSLLSGCPLVFGRTSPNSLTQAEATQVLTIHHGVRKEYKDAASYWLRHLHGSTPVQGAYGRYFASPRSIHSDRSGIVHYDLLVVSDWNMVIGGSFHSAFNMLLAAQANGMTAAILHYPRYEGNVGEPIVDEVRKRMLEHGIEIVAPGETIAADTTVIAYPPILQHFMDRFPRIENTRPVVVVNQMAERDTTGSDLAYDPYVARGHMREYFGTDGDWVPISGWVRRIMTADERYPRPHADTWMPLVDAGHWLSRTPHWRGAQRKTPKLGRHGRDHALKWPGTAAALSAAYCVGRPCDVRFLGGAEHAIAVLGARPPNWQIEPFGARDVKEFLADLDFFLHFPNEAYIEEFGRAPMEAMAIGMPVILPHVFKDTFGEAAIYAEPDEVWGVVEALWKDRAAWDSRVARGREFVLTNCSYNVFPGRVRSTVSPSR